MSDRIIRILCTAKFEGRTTLGDMEDVTDRIFGALLEPTEGMALAGAKELYVFGPEAYLVGDPVGDCREACWDDHSPIIDPFKAMIRAAKEGK